jgi:hypothetical protein
LDVYSYDKTPSAVNTNFSVQPDSKRFFNRQAAERQEADNKWIAILTAMQYCCMVYPAFLLFFVSIFLSF